MTRRTPISPARRAVGYVRVSAVAGRDGDSFLSPAMQREKIEAWAAYRGYEIVAWYTDLDRPAKEGDPRPEFERMMTDATGGSFDVVCVYRLTRFARSVGDAARRYSELKKAGVDLVSVTEDIDTTTAGGQLMQNMLFALAEFESARIGEEWRAVHAARRRRGIAHVTHPPYGYLVEGAQIVGIEPDEAQAVRQMYESRASGSSYREIIRWLEANGYRPRSGTRRFSLRTVFDMLRNPLYAGQLRHNGEVLPATHDPIISRELFDRVQAMHQRANRTVRFRAELLSGLIVCGSCGGRMRVLRHTSHGGKYRRVAYQCHTRYKGDPCAKPVSIAQPRSDAFVEERFLAALDRERMPNRGKVKASRRQKEWQSKAQRLRVRAGELERGLDRLADERYVAGTVEDAAYQRQFKRMATEREEVLNEADELDAMVATIQPLEIDVIDFWPNLTVDEKRHVLRAALAEVVVHPATSRGHGSRVEDRLEIVWLVPPA